MWVGTLELDLLLGGSDLPVRFLKEKRSVVRPLVAELQVLTARQRILRGDDE